MRCLTGNVAIVIVVALFGARPSLAGDMVRNSTSAVLQDHFESPAVGNAPDNGALAGTWSLNNPNPSNTVKIWDATQTPNIAAIDGAQYVNLQRTVSAFTWLVGTFSSPITSGTMDANFLLYIPSTGVGTNIGGSVVFDQTGFQDTISFFMDNSGVVKRYNGTSYVATSIPYTTDAWQEWTLHANLTSQTYSLTVGGITQSGLPFNHASGGNGTFTQILFAASGQPTQLFVDGIPEPSGCAVLGTMSMLAIVRRHRRACTP